MNFYVMRNKDSALAYINALLSAGHSEVSKLSHADFILYDVERPNKYQEYKDFLKNHPGFIYPHTPYSSYFLWDGIRVPLPVQCNFVVAPGVKRGLESIDYPYRVEVVGFSHCSIAPFSPTCAEKILLVVPRPLGHGGYADSRLLIGLQSVYAFLRENVREFEQVTICHTIDHYDGLGLPRQEQFRYIATNPRKANNPAADMVKLIDKHDLVFAIGTAAYLALARGKATVMWGNDLTPRTPGHVAQHSERYMSYFRYPLDFEKMSLDDIFASCQSESEAVTKWKADNIGRNFDRDKFLSVVQEYV